MNKQPYATLVALAFGGMLHAQTKTVTLQNDDLKTTSHRYERPVINYDENVVTIKANTLLYDVTVVVKDDRGEVLHQEQLTVSPVKTEISMSAQAEKNTIEVYCNEEHLYGQFDE